MSPSPKLTDAEKQNGQRAVLIPSSEIQEMMKPISLDEFTGVVHKAIPPSPPDPTEAKQT
jgi:hypothetical protein